MHGITRGLEKRLERLERRLGAVLEPETPDQTARRFELCRAAVAGEIPANLTPEEVALFSKIKASVPLVFELLDEGLVDASGVPSGGDHLDLRYEDETEDGPVWVP